MKMTRTHICHLSCCKLKSEHVGFRAHSVIFRRALTRALQWQRNPQQKSQPSTPRQPKSLKKRSPLSENCPPSKDLTAQASSSPTLPPKQGYPKEKSRLSLPDSKP